MAIEQPKYEVVQKLDDVEVRSYDAYVVAETEVTGDRLSVGSDAFGVLAGYIFGKNKGSKKLAMTAPVTQSQGEKIAMTAPVAQAESETGKWVVQFMMPAGYTLESLPEPLDARVYFKTVPARKVAVIRYSGTWSEKNYEEHLAKLRTEVKAAGLATVGEPVWARYDPPWKPWFMRTNEILLELGPAIGQMAP